MVVIKLMIIESELFFQAIIKPVIIRFANDPYSLSSEELDLLNWYSNKFDHRLARELSTLDEFVCTNLNKKYFSLMNLSDEK
tara:strand:- start:1436 stop:1681 length:246 start_codon:yes stop_codon:yes gene_type:complete